MENKVVEVLTDENNSENVTLLPVEDEAPEKDEALVVNAENAVQIIENGKGIMNLKRPMPDGTKSIYFDFMSISNMKYEGIVSKVEKKKRTVLAEPERDPEVQMEYFSEASGVPMADLRSGITAKDGVLIRKMVYAFLMA